MKKLSLILALIFVFTCSMLAACGDDSADTSSAAESSTGDAGVTASKAESSVAEVESSEAEVESSVAEEESSEAPAEPVELGDNIAAGKTYTISTTDGGTTTTPADTANWNANLTDGQAIDSFDDSLIWGTAAWFGIKSTDNVDASGYAYITIDLGEVSDIAQVKVNLGNNSALGIPKPAEMYVMLSEDGESFVPAEGSLPLQEGDGAYWSELNVTASARFVQLKVFVNGTWCFLNEIEVYAPAA